MSMPINEWEVVYQKWRIGQPYLGLEINAPLSKLNTGGLLTNLLSNVIVIYSPIFDDQTEDKIRWRLELFPKGSSRDCEGYLCLFLKLCNPKEEGHLFVKYRLTLMNSTESTIAMKDWHSTTFNKEHSSSGKLKFVALDLVHSSVINSGNNSVISDQLKVKCEILYEVQQNPVYGCHASELYLFVSAFI